ncbi:MAG: protein kinase domain-containing protein [Gemmatimonadales bacterium]
MTEPIDRIRAALADHYLIERELGRGGMATVYLAQDRKHGRLVALKVLRSDLAAVLGADRFAREIQIAARLQHPHILPLHDSGEAAGFLYYVMPYVEGESLRDRLNRERQLPLEEALRIVREVADALGYAHGHEVVHRDIKPENILLSRGSPGELSEHALVADFGIARAVTAAGSDRLTDTGLALGTPSYMSPEQAAAEQAVDGRADIYALGCVLYEMLAGQPPFHGNAAREVLARHALDPVPPLRTIRPDLPAEVERAVLRALAKAPADRFATVSGFTAALTSTSPPRLRVRWLAPALLVAAGGGILAAIYSLGVRGRGAASGAPAGDSTRSIAVLAFANVGGDSTNEPFSDGVADELTTALGKVEGLSVAARTSSFSFKRKGLDAREIGRRLDVRYVVEGAVRMAGSRRRVSYQLIDVVTGKEVWADQFEHDVRDPDVFAVQDSIARSIVRELQVKLSVGTRARLAKRATENREAHDLYFQGRFFVEKRDLVSLAKARDYFERAIQADSSYALAYAGLSDVYGHESVFGGALPHEAFPKAKAAIQRALQLDSSLVEAHTSQGFISLFYDWDWPAAGRELERAVAIDPRYPPAHLFRGWYFLVTGRDREAIGEFQTAVRLDPFHLINNARLTDGFFYTRRYEDAMAQGTKVLELEPAFFQGHTGLGQTYLQMGRCAEALAELEQVPDGRATSLQGLLGYGYGRCGRRGEAMAESRRLTAARNRRYVSHYALAMIQAGLGDVDRAFAELDSAYAERAWPMIILTRQPAFDRLAAEPRFQVLARKMRLVR